MDELGSDADIFVCGPCREGKNLEWMSAGFGYLSFTAASRVRRKYGSCGNAWLVIRSDGGDKDTPDQWRMESGRVYRIFCQTCEGRSWKSWVQLG